MRVSYILQDLTKSFGWEDADAFTQHDVQVCIANVVVVNIVQELCRVLFDALEKNFKGTEQANIVNDLYQGKMKDYVQCKVSSLIAIPTFSQQK